MRRAGGGPCGRGVLPRGLRLNGGRGPRGGDAEDREVRDEPVLRCARCGQPVARRADAIEVSGQHVHEFVNPSGDAFVLGCFRVADGCAPYGASETFWSWFVGHSWQVALCRGCGTHLGWCFARGASVFHGLILARLV